MPTMKEIAGWLREAELALKLYEELLEGSGKVKGDHGIPCTYEDFADRAAQVEQMHCETCSSWNGDWTTCKSGHSLRSDGYCHHHKLKEVENENAD